MATSYEIPELPLAVDIESRAILKKLTAAHKALAELKGVAASIPNQNILINTLSLQEAKDSSAIENIIITQDDLFQSDAVSVLMGWSGGLSAGPSGNSAKAGPGTGGNAGDWYCGTGR